MMQGKNEQMLQVAAIGAGVVDCPGAPALRLIFDVRHGDVLGGVEHGQVVQLHQAVVVRGADGGWVAAAFRLANRFG